MFRYEFPHFDTLFFAFKQMNSRVRWLLTLSLFLAFSLGWYFLVYGSLAACINSYQDSIAHTLEQQGQFSSRRKLYQQLQQEVHSLKRKLQAVEVTLAGHKQLCMWINRLVHDFNIDLINCSYDSYAKKKSLICTLKGQLPQLQQFCNHVHGLHTGWIIDSLSLQPAHIENQSPDHPMTASDIYIAHITLAETILLQEHSQEPTQ